MPPLILLAVLAGLPLLGITLFRVKPLYVFVSVVTGYFLVTYLGDMAELTFSSIIHVNHPGVVIRLFLLLLPVTLTIFFMRKTLSTAALPFQFFLLVANSLLIAELTLPILTPGTQGAIYQTNAGQVARQAHDVLIAAVCLLHVIVMWIMRPKTHGKPGHHKKH